MADYKSVFKSGKSGSGKTYANVFGDTFGSDFQDKKRKYYEQVAQQEELKKTNEFIQQQQNEIDRRQITIPYTGISIPHPTIGDIWETVSHPIQSTKSLIEILKKTPQAAKSAGEYLTESERKLGQYHGEAIAGQDYIKAIETNNQSITKWHDLIKRKPKLETIEKAKSAISDLMEENRKLAEEAGGEVKNLTNRQMVGTSLAVASDIALAFPIGAGAKTIETVATHGTKGLLKNAIKSSIEGGMVGSVYGLAGSLEQKEPQGFKETAKSVGIGTGLGLLTPLIGVPLKGVKLIRKLLNSKTVEEVDRVATEGGIKLKPLQKQMIAESTDKGMVKEIIDDARKKSQNLLPEGKTPNVKQGEGFVMKENATPEEIKRAKLYSNYQSELEKYNKKPSEKQLDKVFKAREEKNTFMKQTVENLTEAKTPEQVNKVAKESGIKFSEPETNLITQSDNKKVIREIVNSKEPTQGEIPGQNKPIGNVAQNVSVSGTTPSKVAKSIESKAVERKLTEGFGDVAGYDKVTIKNDSEVASKLINEDLDRARRIVRGEEMSPKELKNDVSLIVAMEEHISKTKNIDEATELSMELAKSPLTSETSKAGQTLRITAERKPDSATAHIKELDKVRKETVAKKLGSKVDKVQKAEVETIRGHIKKSMPTKEDWAKFVEEIRCK